MASQRFKVAKNASGSVLLLLWGQSDDLGDVEGYRQAGNVD